MFISIFNDFSTNFSIAKVRAIAANATGFAAFISFAACLLSFDGLFYQAIAAFIALGAVTVALALNSPCDGECIRCCNSVARVLRCQRRSRGFESPQRRFGIGRPVAGRWFVRPKTRVQSPSDPPYLGVAQQ